MPTAEEPTPTTGDTPRYRWSTTLTSQHYRSFLAVVDADGRISLAATGLGLTQPGVTYQLDELERRLGVALFERARGQAARLTRAGRVFEQHAREIARQQTLMFDEIDEQRVDLSGHLRVGASAGPGEHWLPPRLVAFQAGHPGTRTELHVGDARSIIESVVAGELELGFVGGRLSRAGVEFVPVARDEIALIAPPGHRLAGTTSTLADLAGEPFIAQEPGAGMRMTISRELATHGLGLSHFDVVAELGNQESVKSCVAAGAGIGCVWRGSSAAELELGQLVTLDVSDFRPDGTYYMVRRERRVLTRLAQALADFLAMDADEAAPTDA